MVIIKEILALLAGTSLSDLKTQRAIRISNRSWNSTLRNSLNEINSHDCGVQLDKVQECIKAAQNSAEFHKGVFIMETDVEKKYQHLLTEFERQQLEKQRRKEAYEYQKAIREQRRKEQEENKQRKLQHKEEQRRLQKQRQEDKQRQETLEAEQQRILSQKRQSLLQELCALIQSRISEEMKILNADFDSMDGWAFEKFCADIILKNGYEDVSITSGSGDQGIDVIAYRDGIKYGIQCKCYSSPIGNRAIQEVFAGKAFYQCHVGIVLTNNYFTNSATELAQRNGIILWNRDKLLQLIQTAK